MNYKNMFRNITGVILLVSFLFIPFLNPIQKYLSIPDEITLFAKQDGIDLPAINSSQPEVTHAGNIQPVSASASHKIIPVSEGNGSIIYEWAGLPIKKVDVNVLKNLKVIPGGQSIGVRLQTLGVLVVGHHLVQTEDGKISPGEKAGIQVGDILLKINGDKIEEMENVSSYVKKAGENGESLHLTVKRNDGTFETELKPAFDVNDRKYRIGLYIRDSAAGIGTMTFYDPKTKKYGALGHVISDMDTKKPIEIYKGKIVHSNVLSIEKGKNGLPGEKNAQFRAEDKSIGNIKKNSPFGIFGELHQNIKNGIMDEPLPIALSNQVKEGPAKILTVIEGSKVEEFDVEIVSTIPQKHPSTKGMIVKITDPRLLEATGGIVQGMSGSPIIQNNKLVGAITHVFVNDPTSGYGVHIEWMLHDAGIDIYNQKGKRKVS